MRQNYDTQLLSIFADRFAHLELRRFEYGPGAWGQLGRLPAPGGHVPGPVPPGQEQTRPLRDVRLQERADG